MGKRRQPSPKSSWGEWLERLEGQLDLDSLMQGCCRALLQMGRADRCSLMVLDSDTDQLVVRWADGVRVKPSGQRLRFRLGEGLAGWVARSQKAFCSSDAVREPRFIPFQKSARRFRPVKAICCLPLVFESRTVGVVNLSSFSSRRMSRMAGPGARRFLGRLAQVVAQVTRVHEAEAISERLRRQVKVTSETVAQVSHEVRTPLTLIQEAAQQLLDGLGGALTQEQRGRLNLVQTQSDRMLRLVTELLDLSRIEVGRLALRRRPMDLKEAVEDVRSRYEALVSPRTLSIHLEPCPLIYADPVRVTQVVENLLTNAVKFTPPEGRIAVSLAPRGRCAELEVSDNGVGIAPKEQRRLFQKFAQLRVPAAFGGRSVGLGLAIVKEIVQMHGGTVRVHSEAGKGTTFTVSLPLYTPSFALTEEFRVMREQAAREGEVLAVQVLRPKGSEEWNPAPVRELLSRSISRQDQMVEGPNRSVVLLSVIDPGGLAPMRRRLEAILTSQSNLLPRSGLGWGWALVPQEETALSTVLELAGRRCEEKVIHSR